MKNLIYSSRFFILLIVVIGYCSPISSYAQGGTTGISFFQGTWEEALAEGQKQQKPIFVDAYTSWCGWCKKMDKTVFTDANVAQFYNTNYVNFKYNLEKGEGPKFAKRYKVSSYPTLLFFSPEGELVHKVVGARKAEPLIKEGQKFMFDDKKVADMNLEYDNGKRDKDFLINYLTMLSNRKNSDRYNKVANEYFSALSDVDIKKKENLKTILNLANGIDSKPYELLLKHRTAFEAEYGKEKIDQKITVEAFKSLKTSIEKKDKQLYNKVRQILEKADPGNKNNWIIKADLEFYKGIKLWNEYARTAAAYFDNNEVKDASLLNNAAWIFYEHIDNKNLLEKAEKWAKQSITIKSQYHNNDTYAAILFKLGKKANALVAAEKAIVIARMEKKDSKSSKDLIKKIEDSLFE